MIKTLQKKFIVTAMIAITVLLVVLLGVINVVNIWATSQETDRMLGFISHTHTEQKGQPPDRYTERRGIWDHTFSKDDIMSAVLLQHLADMIWNQSIHNYGRCYHPYKPQ